MGSGSSDDGLGSMMKRAFMWHWHLLALGSAVTLSVFSGNMDRFFPVVMAGELIYLFFLGTQTRFQKVLKAEGMQQSASQNTATRVDLNRFLSFLTPRDRGRFDSLRQRAADLLELRRRMESKEGDPSAERFRSDSLDRMLWIFLKLLHQRSGLDRFLQSTKAEMIQAELDLASGQLQASLDRDNMKGIGESRLTVSIRERLATIEGRMENRNKALESLELLNSEIDRTEQQITHLCEVGMTARDTDGLTARMESLSASLQSSEQIFSSVDLDPIFDEDVIPPMLNSPDLPPARPQPQRRAVRQ